MIGIYTITEIQTGKIYVGQSVDIHRRWKKHQKNRPLSSYIYRVEQVCCVGLLNLLEQYFIKKFDTLKPKGLNRTVGGSGNFGFFDQETRQKISQSLRGRVISEETKKKMSESNKARVFSEEHRQKLREAQKSRRSKEKVLTNSRVENI